jgi:biotin carboxylase
VDVIAVDRDPGAVGFPLATERAVLSSEDEEGIDRLARARGVDGIVSPGADWPVAIAARVAGRIGLPHPIDARTGTLATSKARQREAFAAADVPHAAARDLADGRVTLPCVVKAPDRQGQRGLALVRSREELAPALAAARAESRTGAVLVEDVVDGPEVTVNAVSVGGRFVPLTVTDRLTAGPPAFGVALAHVWPSLHDTAPAVRAARAAVEAIGIGLGPSYTQLLLGRDGPVVIEVAARLGGGHDAELCEAALGVDLNGLAIDAALGRASTTVVDAPDGVPVGVVGGAAVVFLVAPAGRLVAVQGTEEAEAIDGVRWVRVYRRPGDVVRALRRGADRAGAVLATGSSRDEALDRARRAADAVRFRVDADAP